VGVLRFGRGVGDSVFHSIDAWPRWSAGFSPHHAARGDGPDLKAGGFRIVDRDVASLVPGGRVRRTRVCESVEPGGGSAWWAGRVRVLRNASWEVAALVAWGGIGALSSPGLPPAFAARVPFRKRYGGPSAGVLLNGNQCGFQGGVCERPGAGNLLVRRHFFVPSSGSSSGIAVAPSSAEEEGPEVREPEAIGWRGRRGGGNGGPARPPIRPSRTAERVEGRGLWMRGERGQETTIEERRCHG